MTEAALTHHRIDTVSKLLGLALIAAGMEVGPLSSAGLLLVAAGIVSGTATVFTNNE